MSRSFELPGWARRHFVFALALTIGLAVILRLSPHDSEGVLTASTEPYLPVAAAIGLSSEVPADAALATWVNSGLYAVGLRVLTICYPDASVVDFGTAFLCDPDRFCALARFAALAAAATSIYLTWVLVSRLLDPAAGLSAAFILAVHPAVVALTGGVGSGAFSLLFLLCGLLIATRINWHQPRPVEFAATGLSLGFALDSIPIAAVLFGVVIIVGLRETAPGSRRHLAAPIGIGVAFFTIAAAAVIPSGAPLLETAWITGLSILIVGALIVAGYALRSAREIVGPSTYSAVALSLGLAVGVIAVMSPPDPAPVDGADVYAQASRWMVRHTPGDSVVVIDPELADSISLPRNTRSWQREYERVKSGPDSARLYAVAGARAAMKLPGPRFDVIVAPPAGQTGGGRPSEAQYLVLPDTEEAAELAASAACWMVARFRARDAHGPGVTIWGTRASPEVEAIPIEWRLTRGHMMASAAL